MPGLHLVFKNGISSDEVARASDDLKHKDEITVSEWIRDDNTLILFSSYDGYPCSFIDKKDFLIIVEGMIYDRADSEVGKTLSTIAGDYLAGNDYKEGIKDFISKSDGDFLVLILFKKKYEAIIFNDRWGRLPSFYSSGNGIVAFSREIKFILHWLPEIVLDKSFMAQFLLFESSLGSRTIVDSVKRLPPATVLKIRQSSHEMELETIFRIDFTFDGSRSGRHKIIQRVVELFQNSVQDRVKKLMEYGYGITSDLSGGYDTRAVLAALVASGTEFQACTDKIVTGDESALASKVASHFNVDLLVFDARYPVNDIYEHARLTYITDGMINCYTTLTCFHDDLEREKAIEGRQANFMGFGGETIRHPLKPKSGYTDLIEMMADDVFSSFLDMSAVCSILNFRKDRFLRCLKMELEEFPEKNISDKLKHLYFDLHDKQVKGGEDRHRLFRWTLQPFWSMRLFDFEMHNIPLELIDDDFFIEFISGIDPRTLDLPFKRRKFAFNSRQGRAFLRSERNLIKLIRDNRHSFKIAKSFIRAGDRLKYPRKSWSGLAETALNIFMSDRFYKSIFNVDEVVRFIRNCRNGRQFYQVLTLILYVLEIKKRFGDKIQISQ